MFRRVKIVSFFLLVRNPNAYFSDGLFLNCQSSGVTVSTEAKTVYEEVKKDKKYRYIIYHIKDEKVIDVETTAPRDATYPQFLEQLQKFKTECRYCVFDFPANIPVEGSQDKTSMSVDRLVLMTWYGNFFVSFLAPRLRLPLYDSQIWLLRG